MGKSSRYVFQATDPITDFYDLGTPIGQRGQFGIARRAKHKKTGEERAVKIISKNRFSRKMDRQFHFQQLKAEIYVMKRMNHENIICLHDVFEDAEKLYIVMELCRGGELFDRIKEMGSYSEKDAAKVLQMICKGIHYMHSKNVAHCDLKPDNFLFTTKSPDAQLKIIDFGMSKFVKRRNYFRVLCGTPYYVAPEVIDGKYSESCDMWSLGVVMFVMIFGYPPFYADQATYGDRCDEEIFRLVKKGFQNVTMDGYGGHFPAAIPCSESAKDLISKLLDLDPARRLTAAEALDHKWMTGEDASDAPVTAKVVSNLTSFTGAVQFKAALLSAMTDILTDEDLQELKDTFERIDVDKNGTITLTELKQAMAKDGISASFEQIKNAIEAADVDGDGCLSYEELVLTGIQRKLLAKEERMWAAFCKLDIDGDGRLTKDELREVLADANIAQEVIDNADQDGDGRIDYDEFVQMWSDAENKQAVDKSHLTRPNEDAAAADNKSATSNNGDGAATGGDGDKAGADASNNAADGDGAEAVAAADGDKLAAGDDDANANADDGAAGDDADAADSAAADDDAAANAAAE